MLNIYHQSVEDILKAATPEQRLLWNWVFLTFGERVPISQVYYVGATAGTEFLTYQTNKYYIAYELNISGAAAGAAASGNLALFNTANVQYHAILNSVAYWDATAAAARYLYQYTTVKNVHFSRIIANGLGSFSFVGYRIGI